MSGFPLFSFALVRLSTAWAGTTLNEVSSTTLEEGVVLTQYRASSPSTDVWVLRVDLCADNVYGDAVGGVIDDTDACLRGFGDQVYWRDVALGYGGVSTSLRVDPADGTDDGGLPGTARQISDIGGECACGSADGGGLGGPGVDHGECATQNAGPIRSRSAHGHTSAKT